MTYSKKVHSILFFFCLVMVTVSVAQNGCPIDSIMRYKGNWIKDNDENMRDGQGMQQVIARIDKFQKIIHEATPNLRGLQARWERNMDWKPLMKNGPIPYQLTIGLFICGCNVKSNKMIAEDETGTWIFVSVNSFSWFLHELGNVMESSDFTIENDPIYILPKQTSELNGFLVYDGDPEQTAGSIVYSKTILITRPGQLPYKPVTKGEYLKVFITHFEKEKERSLRELNPKFRKASSEQYKQKPKSKSKPISNMNVDSSEDTNKEEQKLDSSISQHYDEEIKPYHDLLMSMSDEEKQKPAIIDRNAIGKLSDFATPNRTSSLLVRTNHEFFKMNEPNFQPQIIVVHWTWDDLIPTKYWEDQLEKNLDLNKLKAMLDK